MYYVKQVLCFPLPMGKTNIPFCDGTIGIRRSCREGRYANFTSPSSSLVNMIVASMLIAATLQ